jgi:hypothetical protein
MVGVLPWLAMLQKILVLQSEPVSEAATQTFTQSSGGLNSFNAQPVAG